MKNIQKFLLSTFVLLAVFFALNINSAEAVYVTELSPNNIDNAENTRIDVYGMDFTRDTVFTVGVTDLEVIELYSSNHALVNAPKGLDDGLHDMIITNTNDDTVTIVPDILNVYGNESKLRVINVVEEAYPGGVKTTLEFNKPARAKLYAGEDSEHLVVQIRKGFSDKHILPFNFPIRENYLYYVTQIEAKDEIGNKLTLPLKTWKLISSGVKIDVPLEYDMPNVEYNFDNNSAEINFLFNKPVGLKVRKSLFEDGAIEPVEYEGFDDVVREHKIVIDDLDLNTLYYLKIEGKTDAPSYKRENFEMNLRLFYSKSQYVLDKEAETNLAETEPQTLEVETDLAEEKDMLIDEEENVDSDFYSDFTEENNWAIPYIEALKDDDIVKGNEDGKFDPDRLTTRSEMVMLLTRASELDLPESPAAYFVDVPKDHHAFKPLAYFVENDIDRGLGDGKFGLDEPITRKDAIRMLLKVLKIEPVEDVSKSSFSDVSLDGEYLGYIEAALKAGFISPSGVFRPDDPLKRVESAKIIALAYGLADAVEYNPILSEDLVEQAEDVSEEEDEVVSEEPVVVDDTVEDTQEDVATEEVVTEDSQVDEGKNEVDLNQEEDILDSDVSLEDLLKLL